MPILAELILLTCPAAMDRAVRTVVDLITVTHQSPLSMYQVS